MINPGIFREYDIRGNADRDLSNETVRAIGQALAAVLHEKKALTIALGQDVRLTSPRIARTLSDTLLSAGISVIDIGTVPTPLLYYALFRLPVEGGAMVTASHNPSPDNGIKLAIGRETIYGEAILLIRQKAIAFESGPTYPSSSPEGTLSVHSLIDTYVDEIASRFGRLPSPGGRPLKVVVDCGNATAGLVVRKLYEPLGIDLTILYEEPDGRFPHHHPDPTVAANLRDLKEVVLHQKADLGIAFDGDSDRIGVVDERGAFLFGDQLLVLFAEEVLARHPGSRIISEVKASKFLYDRIADLGGIPDMWKAGHSLIKARMRETGALLAGEMSGHIFFADDYYGYDDALYAGLRLMALVARSGAPLSALLSSLPRTFSTPELRRFCPDEKKFEVVERLKSLLRDKEVSFNDIDGIRSEFKDGWGLVRASNTQPALVLRFEANTSGRMKEIQEMITASLAVAMESEGLDPSLAGQDLSHH